MTTDSLPAQTTHDLDRTHSIQRTAGTQGWTVFEIPSTPGLHLVYRPPLVGAAALHPLRVVAGRSSAAPRAASLGDWDEFPCPVSLGHDRERREPPGAMGAVLPKLAAALLQLEEGGRSRFIEGAGRRSGIVVR